MRGLALPDAVEQWSLTSLRENSSRSAPRLSAMDAESYARWPRSPFRETRSLIFCAASTGSDRSWLRHDRWDAGPLRRRQDQCVWHAAEGPVLAPPLPPAVSPSDGIGLQAAARPKPVALQTVPSHDQLVGGCPYEKFWLLSARHGGTAHQGGQQRHQVDEDVTPGEPRLGFSWITAVQKSSVTNILTPFP